MFEPVVINTGAGEYLIDADGSYVGVSGSPADVVISASPENFDNFVKQRQNAWTAYLAAKPAA